MIKGESIHDGDALGVLQPIGDCILLLAFSGLRVNKALPLQWKSVNWDEGVIQVTRLKKGTNPWVPVNQELEILLKNMKLRSTSRYLFPSPRAASQPIAYPTVAHALRSLCLSTKMKYVTCHGMRSFFVTQCREARLSDAEIAALIGDKTGPAIIALTYAGEGAASSGQKSGGGKFGGMARLATTTMLGLLC